MHVLLKNLKLSTGVWWVLVFEDSSAQIFESSGSLLNFNSGKVLFIKQCEASQQWPWITVTCWLVCSSVWRKHICSQSDSPAIWEFWSWIDYSPHFFFWDPVTSFHFNWGMYKMYVSWVPCLETGQAVHTKTISRCASPKSTWLSCSPAVRRLFTDSLGVGRRTMWRDTQASWQFVASEAPVAHLNPRAFTESARLTGSQTLEDTGGLQGGFVATYLHTRYFLFHHHFNRKTVYCVLLFVCFSVDNSLHYFSVCNKTGDNSYGLVFAAPTCTLWVLSF